MKKIKTETAEGMALNWLVAQCEECQDIQLLAGDLWLNFRTNAEIFSPVTNWLQAGKIIDREKLRVGFYGEWCGSTGVGSIAEAFGPDALTAVMRAYVMSKMGYQVEVPEEVL